MGSACKDNKKEVVRNLKPRFSDDLCNCPTNNQSFNFAN